MDLKKIKGCSQGVILMLLAIETPRFTAHCFKTSHPPMFPSSWSRPHGTAK